MASRTSLVEAVVLLEASFGVLVCGIFCPMFWFGFEILSDSMNGLKSCSGEQDEDNTCFNVERQQEGEAGDALLHYLGLP